MTRSGRQSHGAQNQAIEVDAAATKHGFGTKPGNRNVVTVRKQRPLDSSSALAERTMSTTACSQAQMVTHVFGSRLKAQELHSSLSAHERIHPPVILLVLTVPYLSQPTSTRSTTWTARSSPRTLYTSTFLETQKLIQLHS